MSESVYVRDREAATVLDAVVQTVARACLDNVTGLSGVTVLTAFDAADIEGATLRVSAEFAETYSTEDGVCFGGVAGVAVVFAAAPGSPEYGFFMQVRGELRDLLNGSAPLREALLARFPGCAWHFSDEAAAGSNGTRFVSSFGAELVVPSAPVMEG